MDIDWYIQVFLLIVLLLTTALFSGLETALFSLDKEYLKIFKKKNSVLGAYLTELIDFPERLRITVIIVNSVTIIGEVFISLALAVKISMQYQISRELVILFIIILLTVLIFSLVELFPKALAVNHPIIFTKITCIPVYWTSILIYPVTKIIRDILKFTAWITGINKIINRINLEQIKIDNDLADLSSEKKQEDISLIKNLADFKEIIVREIMTPRVDVTAVSNDTSFQKLIEIIVDTNHSRIPLYNENLDNILGIIYAKDLLPYLKDEMDNNIPDLEKIARKAMFVPETKLISDLMHEFQEKKMHLSIVVDEYGGTSGLISLDDILEEIIGEIRDEYDNEEAEIIKLNNDSFLVLGKTSIDQVNEIMGINLYAEEEYYDTIGGFVLNYSGFIPKEGYSFTYKNHKFTVKEIRNRRVNKVLVEKLTEDK